MSRFWRPIGALRTYIMTLGDLALSVPLKQAKAMISTSEVLVWTPSILYYNDDAAKPHFPHEAFVMQGTCLNPCDLVYSFLGLSNSPTPFAAVDYSKPVDKVLLDFALAACHGSEANLVLIAICYTTSRSIASYHAKPPVLGS